MAKKKRLTGDAFEMNFTADCYLEEPWRDDPPEGLPPREVAWLELRDELCTPLLEPELPDLDSYERLEACLSDLAEGALLLALDALGLLSVSFVLTLGAGAFLAAGVALFLSVLTSGLRAGVEASDLFGVASRLLVLVSLTDGETLFDLVCAFPLLRALADVEVRLPVSLTDGALFALFCGSTPLLPLEPV